MIIAQLSDPHVVVPGDASFLGIDTAATLGEAAERLAALRPRPDVVLLTGDLVAHGTAAEYAALRICLAPLDMPIYLIPGNHDERDVLRAAFPDHAYLPIDGEFLHYTVEDYEIRLIGLDTVIPGQVGGEICPARLAWLAARLEEAPTRPTVVFMHHPPFATGIAAMDASPLAGDEAFGEVIARHSQVERVLCGHVHRPVQLRWRGTIASIAPSTAVAAGLTFHPEDSFDWSREPPGFALHLWQPGTGLVTHIAPVRDFDAA